MLCSRCTPRGALPGNNAGTTFKLLSGGASLRFNMGVSGSHIRGYAATATTFIFGGSGGVVNFANLGCALLNSADKCEIPFTPPRWQPNIAGPRQALFWSLRCCLPSACCQHDARQLWVQLRGQQLLQVEH